MKCKECGNELLTGDRYWQMGLCNECWSAYRFFNKPIPLNNTHDKIIEELQQQLAEKDKEIERLSNKEFEHFGDMKTYKNMWLAEQRKNKELRHQVCEEIKDWINTHCEWNEVGHIKDLYWGDLNKGLDQIEKGENDAKN